MYLPNCITSAAFTRVFLGDFAFTVSQPIRFPILRLHLSREVALICNRRYLWSAASFKVADNDKSLVARDPDPTKPPGKYCSSLRTGFGQLRHTSREATQGSASVTKVEKTAVDVVRHSCASAAGTCNFPGSDVNAWVTYRQSVHTDGALKDPRISARHCCSFQSCNMRSDRGASDGTNGGGCEVT